MAGRLGPELAVDGSGGGEEAPATGAGTLGAAQSERAAGFSPVVVAPTYNNAGTVVGVVGRIVGLGLPVIVVDDGCTDATYELLSRSQGAEGVGDALEIVRHPRNLGKARALLTGFGAAAAHGYSHAVTIDTDGQLDPESIPALLEAARGAPTALVLGVRGERIEGCPGRSMVGRRLSNLAIRCECGVRVRDSQCGLRVYPLDAVVGGRAPRWRAGRFAFEAEVITRLAWAGRPIEEVEVPCRYLPRDVRVSHFKPWRDSLGGIGLHARLLAVALLPWGGRTRPAGLRHTGGRRRRFAGFRAWISPVALWRQIRDQRAGRAEVALGFSIGVFIANLPIYGVQTLTGLYVAHRLHLHPVPVVAGSHVSTPPLGLVLIGAAIGLGHLLLHGTWIWTTLDGAGAPGPWTMAGWMLADWIVGSVVVGLVSAAASLAGVWLLLGLVARKGRSGGRRRPTGLD